MRRGTKTIIRVSCMIVPIAAIFLYFFFVKPFFVKPMGCSHDYLQCDGSLRNINIALWKYADDHYGKYPAKLKDLHPKYINLSKNRCPMCEADRESLETGYHYIPGLSKDLDDKKAVLFCKHYHLNGHANPPYCSQFSILTLGGGIVHARTYDLRKYDGPRRRYVYFRKFPYDGSKPTLKLVLSLEKRFPEEYYARIWMSIDKKEEPSQ